MWGFSKIIIGSVLNSKLINKNGKSSAATLKVKGKAATDPVKQADDSRRYNTRRRRSANDEVEDVMEKLENMKL